jgi:hypothetical protein
LNLCRKDEQKQKQKKKKSSFNLHYHAYTVIPDLDQSRDVAESCEKRLTNKHNYRCEENRKKLNPHIHFQKLPHTTSIEPWSITIGIRNQFVSSPLLKQQELLKFSINSAHQHQIQKKGKTHFAHDEWWWGWYRNRLRDCADACACSLAACLSLPWGAAKISETENRTQKRHQKFLRAPKRTQQLPLLCSCLCHSLRHVKRYWELFGGTYRELGNSLLWPPRPHPPKKSFHGESTVYCPSGK